LAKDVDLAELANLTENHTGAGIELLVREALNLRFSKCLRLYESKTEASLTNPDKPSAKTLIEIINETPLTLRHFKEALCCLPDRGGKDAPVPS
jgi:SpoVK/Ycf46/Vps4 family AAA+-type ATPase